MKTSPEQVAEALRASLKETERLRERNRRLAEAAGEPIAIVGMSCRYPGGASSPEQLWDLLASGTDAIDDFPSDRGWDLSVFRSPGSERLSAPFSCQGGFVHDAPEFDREFFEISPREALGMDAQQRLLLEITWEALEHAGVPPGSLSGSQTGVFAGLMYHDYGWGLSPSQDSAIYLSTGASSSIASGRVAYTFGFEGPAISVDTACSSSLVALHLATQALRAGECSLALAGGATVLSTPGVFIQFAGQRALAPDGRCKSYAEGADGTGFSEGAAMLVLERLSDARANGHQILATIRGSAVNQDGASNGLTAPNGPSQERVIRQALENARLTAADVDAVEGHGTGTPLGDPIEASALLATYGAERSAERPLRLGSIKSNIGHPQAAAGVAGVIKMVLAMQGDLLPRTLHVGEPSSNVDWSSGAVELLTEPLAWGPGERPRRAAVSSFGATGTNAHLILEEAPAVEAEEAMSGAAQGGAGRELAPLRGPVLLPLSAKSEPALQEAAARLATRLDGDPDLEPSDAGFALATGRTAFAQRATVVGESREQLLAGLAGLQRGEAVPGLARGRATISAKVAFLFPGQGSQWAGMAAELLAASPVFERRLVECDTALSQFLDWSVLDLLNGADGAPSIERIEVVQPVLFAVSAALAELWRSCGVVPAAVAGHSQGEIAAAHAAGGLSLEDAARLAAVRSQIISRLAGQGAMVSVALPVAEALERIEPWGERIEVAAENGPSSTILSADREAVEEFLVQCEQQEVRAREVPATIPSHSARVEPLREELLEALAPISPRSGDIPFLSTVTGAQIDTGELDAEYWYRNLRQPVRFEAVTRRLLEQGHKLLVEVSPHPVFSLAVGETIEAVLDEPETARVIGTLRRDEGGGERFALSLAEAHVAGANVDWSAVFADSGARRVHVPTYPFQRRRYWLNASSGAGDLGAAGLGATEHPLLAARIDLARDESLAITGRLSLATHPWLADHALAGTVLLPGTAFLELALLAGAEQGCETIEELTLQAPLILGKSDAVVLQVFLAAAGEDGRRELTIHSRPHGEDEDGAEWTCHAVGTLGPQAAPPAEGPSSWPPQDAQPLDVELAYERLAAAGFEYGPAFQGLTAAWQAGDELFAQVALPEDQAEEASRYALHPALLDAAGHAGIDLALRANGTDGADTAAVPFAWRGVSLHARGRSRLRLRLAPHGEGGGLTAFDEDGGAVASIESVVMRPVDPGVLRAAARRNLPLHRLAWSAATTAEQNGGPRMATLGGEAIDGVEAERYADLAALREAVEGGAPLPELVVADFRASGGELPGAARATTESALELIKAWLGAGELAESRLCLLTEGAVAVEAGEDPDLVASPLWGLLRSAQSEHPGRFALLDSDGSAASREVLSPALASGATEPQLALREGELLVPRLTRAAPTEPAAAEIDPERTVLVTGATGALGSLVARHLASEHGARRLLLASRSGEGAEGAAELRMELEELGAEVRIAACDLADRGQLEELLGSISDEHPLGAVFHCAGVLDDGVVESLDAERLGRVMGPKADAAWHLHELSAGTELSAFVLFSSIMGILGGAGQANYAAANAFLDALAAHRRAQGLPGLSLAWGGWARLSGMIEGEREEIAPELARLAEQIRQRVGLAPMPPEQGLALLDAALLLPDPLLVPAALDSAVLRSQAAAGTLPAVLSGLVRAPAADPERGSLAARLAGAPEAEHGEIVLSLVRTHVAAVLGHSSVGEVDPSTPFRDLGFDSLAAVELRNRLVAASGLRLPATVVFDYPSVAALADHLADQVAGGDSSAATPGRRARSDEPIAIVGMACRYPGGVTSPAGLWQLVAARGDAISNFPEDRGWDLDRLYDPDPGRLGSSYVRQGGFVHDSPAFDPGFFGISPREALGMDPQERVLLESCWEALEDCGVDPHGLRGSATGVFAGVMYQDYGIADYGGGMTSSGVSGRVAYTFGFEGPAITVDTACSSSLVAMHLAAQSLRAGECEIALAGGVAVLSTPGIFAFFSRQRGLAPDGRCKPFAEGADGTAIAEGSGVVLLERLADAEANGHPVLATIRGSAVNQDGASNGLTAPNGPSQERVIRQALANAGLAPQDVDAVEAHGTGTMLGDPIEAGALLATYGQDRDAPLRLGSVKSNIGHAQAAAGVAGVIKTVMAMREGVLPPTLHVDSPSTKVEWERGRVELLAEAQPWPVNGRPRRAGVSSFGASGTNAHLILEAQAAAETSPEAAGDQVAPAGPIPLVLSARSEPALREAARRLADHLEANPDLAPLDVAHSLLTTRAAFEHRAVALGDSRESLLARLGALAEGEGGVGTVSGRVAAGGKLAYLFTGQGAQRVGMGAELRQAYPAYAAALEEVLAALAPHMDHPLEELLFCDSDAAEAELLDHTAYAQPALFATEVALYRLLSSFGLEPQLLAGHSIGELVAAHVAGVLSLPDAAKLVASRGRLMGELPAGGAMLAVEADEQEALESLQGQQGELSLAAINGPTSVVLSGAEGAIAEVEEHWRARQRKTRRLSVSHAFHSPLIEPMLVQFAAVAESLEYREPQIQIVSGCSAEVLSTAEVTDPAYWVAQAREPVRFADAVASLEAAGAIACLELGPDGVLTAMAEETLAASERPLQLAPAMRRGRSEVETVIAAIAHAHAAGVDFDWLALFAGSGAGRVALPTYPFQRKRYWLSPGDLGRDLGAAGLEDAEHPLLGAAIDSAEGEGRTLTGRISLQTHAWLADHAVFDTVLLPGTALVELALRAGDEVGCELLEELTLHSPLILPEQGAVQVQVTVGGPDGEGRREIAIHSRRQSGADEGAAEWTRHAEGLLVAAGSLDDDPGMQTLSDSTWPPPGAEPLGVEQIYERLDERGIEYGPAFRCVRAAWRRGEEVFAELSLPEEQLEQAGRFGLHPALFDAAGHVAADFALGAGGEESQPGTLALPFAWHGVRLASSGASSLRVRLRSGTEGGGLIAVDAGGAAVLSVDSVVLHPVEAAQLQALARDRRSLYRVGWQAPAVASREIGPERLAILGEEDIEGLATAERHAGLAALLEAIGDGEAPAVVVAPFRRTSGAQADPLAACHANAAGALELVQAWLAAPLLAASRLVLLTEGAVAVGAEESPDLGAAALWGLGRSAHSEHPGHFALLDSDRSEASSAALATALLVTEQEPQLALRGGELLVPRLLRVADAEHEQTAPHFDPEATVLISGGTSGIGALLARHLATEHGARRLLLASRSGEGAEGAAELRMELEELGAEVRIAACDLADRGQLEELLGSIPAKHPLGAVIHSAGVLDDGVLESLDRERLERVLAPKVDAAWHLHELTAGIELSHFLLFSSVAGVLGAPGQANYAAANSFLDALAAERQARGLPATSMAWGGWALQSGMAAGAEAQMARAIQQIRERLGLTPMSPAQGLDLFEAARGLGEPLLVPAQLDGAALRGRAQAGTLPPILRALIRVPRGGEVERGSLAKLLAGVPEAEREAKTLELIRGHIAAVLGHESAAEIDPERPFQDLGFDSLAAVELRNRLGAATGMRLAPTLVFDYPTARALAGYLVGEVAPDEARAERELKEAEVREAIAGLEAMLVSVKGDPTARERVGARLRSLLVGLSDEGEDVAVGVAAEELESMSHDEMFELIDEEFGEVVPMSDEAKLRQYLERLTVDLRKAHRRVQDLEQAAREPIAIVGMACRYPGDVDSPRRLWDLVAAGTDAISDFPTDRGWDMDRLYDPDPASSGTLYARGGGFLTDAAGFDPGFFGISPREAEIVDPQERLLLEAAWGALEDAAIPPPALRGSRTGVFAGSMMQEYGPVAALTSSGVSGRISYTLGLEGPAVSLDTACSSSLVAVHLAAQTLRQGDCSLALAGGVTVLATPGAFLFFSAQRGLAADGRCKSFAEAADGVGISEGVGLLVLERLSDARRNGHRVLATIRGSAVNQDGASNGLTAPNGPSQERVIRQALDSAGLEASDVDAVEGHGTGTVLGDPIEAGAILATYGQNRERPLRLGSLKSNIGHAQAAAGVAGVIKTVMAMQEGVLPKTLHVDAPSSKVDWAAGSVELLTEAQPWSANGRPRRAAVSSFGVSGTNAHLILEEALSETDGSDDGGGGGDGAASERLPGPLLLPLSAKSEPALAELATQLASYLAENPGLGATDVAYSLGTSRAPLEQRATLVGEDRAELLSGLLALGRGEEAGIARGQTGADGKLAFLFTGQGSQRAGMGHELHASHPIFAAAFDEVCGQLDPHLEAPPLAQVVFGQREEASALLDDTTYAQPALFAFEVALYRLLKSLGLAPQLLAGHSIGELAAAHVAGVLSLPDAAKLVASRGRLMGELPVGGAMLAVEASEAEAEAAIESMEAELAIAAINGPTSVVLSGAAGAIEEAETLWRERGRRTKRLAVSHAFHSPLIEPMLAEFEALARELEYHEPRLAIVSNLSGRLLDGEQATDPAYWVAQVREPVRFGDAIATLREQGATTFLELGPGAVLSPAAQECLEQGDTEAAAGCAFVPTLRKGRSEPQALAEALAAVHCRGADLDWEALFAGTGAATVSLPTYPFQRKRYWLDASSGGAEDPRVLGQAAAGHPLLGARIAIAGSSEVLLTGSLSARTHPWLADHSLGGIVLVPGTALIELALRAGSEVGVERLEELTLQAPLILPERGATQIQVAVAEPDAEGLCEVAVHSRLEEEAENGSVEAMEWTCHATGLLAPAPPLAAAPLGSWPPEGAEPLEVEDLYERLAEQGFEYGPTFQGVKAAWRHGDQLLAELSLPEQAVQEAQRFCLHPALLDAAAHAGAGLALEAGTEEGLAVPFSWRGVQVASRGVSSLRVRVDLGAESRGLFAFDEAGEPVAAVESVDVRAVDPSVLQAGVRSRLPLYRLEWIEVAAQPANGSEPPRVVALGEARDAELAEERYADLDALLEAIEGDTAPDVVLASVHADAEGVVEAAHSCARQALALLQRWLGEERLRRSRLCVQTECAVAVGGEESLDLGAAPIWGLLRSAQNEHPDRFALLDLDREATAPELLAAALGAGLDEPQLAIRGGRLLAPRIARAPVEQEQQPAPPPLDPEATVLISGGTSGLGALLARHLATEHDARHLLLASRSGEGAEGAAELRAELEELGAEVRIAACDLADRGQLEALLGSIPTEHRLGAVVHAAGVLEDGLLESLDAEKLDRVFAPKVDAAWHLHELTAGMDIAQLAIFSSFSGILGTPGQANYAAANSFLDALAAKRRSEGLPALSLAWGAWAQETGMIGKLEEADLQRAGRFGISLLPPQQGLALFDLAWRRDDALLAPVGFDRAGLRAQAAAGALPAVLRSVVGSAAKAPERGSLVKRLRELPEAEWDQVVLDLVRSHVAAVLGHASAEGIEPAAAFMDLGFDSMAAVELRNRLNVATGLRLPPTLVFDHPSAAAVAEHLIAEVAAEAGGEKRSAGGEREAAEVLAALTAMLPAAQADERVRALLDAGLRGLLADLSGLEDSAVEDGDEDLGSMSHDEVFELIDEELGA